MKSILALFIFLLGFSNLYSQSTKTTGANDSVYTFVQDKPEFPGDIMIWLSNNIKYPSDAKEKNEQGTVYVSFIIEKDGSLSNIKVTRSVSASLDKEAIRAVSNMPRWTAAKLNGKPVRVSYLIPIRFNLN